VSAPAEFRGKTFAIDQLQLLATDLLKNLGQGAVVWLEGELGGGKTTFARLLVQEAGGEEATSPSFALVNEYPTPEGVIYHSDCYRLRSPEEAIDLDLWRLAKTARILLVEWPQKGGDNVPPPAAVMRFEHTDDPDLRVVSVKFC
jgi:tRNA threonylcarbamoyladenosine biosynthesis protein TsaE